MGLGLALQVVAARYLALQPHLHVEGRALQRRERVHLELVVHPFPALKRASFDVKVRLEREIARRNYLKSQAEIRA